MCAEVPASQVAVLSPCISLLGVSLRSPGVPDGWLLDPLLSLPVLPTFDPPPKIVQRLTAEVESCAQWLWMLTDPCGSQRILD